MKSLCHLLPSVGDGGAEGVATMLHTLARAHGVDSVVHPRLREDLRAPWTSWVRWALRAPRAPEVVHAHLPWPDRLGAALLAARGRPMVVTFHLLPTGDWPRDRLLKLPSPRVLRAAAERRHTRWVALSQRDRADLHVCGVPAEIVRNAPPPPVANVAPVRFPDGVVRLASVGRLHPQKGFDLMLDALAPLRHLPWHWCVAGDGESHEALVAQCDRLGLGDRVTFLGRVPASSLLASADLFLAPSRAEGMPLAPMEAVEAGVPVIASDIAPHLELFADASESIFNDDPGGWTRRLDGLITHADERAELLAAQRVVLGGDPRERLWRDYASLYRAVLEDR
jgi:glycosyltransferase involved in cell wall biosynthesis